jgi:hypothetical protein
MKIKDTENIGDTYDLWDNMGNMTEMDIAEAEKAIDESETKTNIKGK